LSAELGSEIEATPILLFKRVGFYILEEYKTQASFE